MFFMNGDVCEEFVAHEHHVGHTCNRPALSFRVTIDYHEGCNVLVHAGDEEHPRPICLLEPLSSPNFVPTSPNFCQINTIAQALLRDSNALHIYLGWDTKKGFKWTMKSTYALIRINTHTILRAWKLHRKSKLESMTNPQNA